MQQSLGSKACRTDPSQGEGGRNEAMNAAVPEIMCLMEIKQHTRMLQHPPKKKIRTGGDHWDLLPSLVCMHSQHMVLLPGTLSMWVLNTI